MFVAGGIWCLADVSSVSPSSEQTALTIHLLLCCNYSLSDHQNMFAGSLLICFLGVSSKWGLASHPSHPPDPPLNTATNLALSVSPAGYKKPENKYVLI